MDGMSAEMFVHLHLINCIFLIFCLCHLQKFPNTSSFKDKTSEVWFGCCCFCSVAFFLFWRGNVCGFLFVWVSQQYKSWRETCRGFLWLLCKDCSKSLLLDKKKNLGKIMNYKGIPMEFHQPAEFFHYF